MKTKHIIVGLIIVLVVLFFIQQKEHAGFTSNTQTLSNEAVQNIAKVYADTSQIATFNNIRANGKITGNIVGDVSGNVVGDISGNNGTFKTISSSDTTTLNNVSINGTLTGKTKGNTLIVDKLCFTNGTCISPTSGLIGLEVYKKDLNNNKVGVTFSADGNGNDASINPIGASVNWLRLGAPRGNDYRFTVNANPYD